MYRKIIIFLTITLLPNICFAQSQGGGPPAIRTARNVAEWLTSEFVYEWEMLDYWQKAEETVRLKKGDCEDFAILSQEMLDNIGVKCEIAIVKFQDLNYAHAICIWKEKGSYRFMSNRELVETGVDSIQDAIEKVYPDWEKITFTTAENQLGRVVRRKE